MTSPVTLAPTAAVGEVKLFVVSVTIGILTSYDHEVDFMLTRSCAVIIVIYQSIDVVGDGDVSNRLIDHHFHHVIVMTDVEICLHSLWETWYLAGTLVECTVDKLMNLKVVLCKDHRVVHDTSTDDRRLREEGVDAILESIERSDSMISKHCGLDVCKTDQIWIHH